MGMYVRGRRLSGSNKATLVWIPRYQRMPENKDADKLAKEGTNKFPCDQTTDIPFVVCKEVSRESSVSGAPGQVASP
jgi:ribonuclease HI